MGLRWPVPSMRPRAPCFYPLIQGFTHTQRFNDAHDVDSVARSSRRHRRQAWEFYPFFEMSAEALRTDALHCWARVAWRDSSDSLLHSVCMQLLNMSIEYVSRIICRICTQKVFGRGGIPALMAQRRHGLINVLFLLRVLQHPHTCMKICTSK